MLQKIKEDEKNKIQNYFQILENHLKQIEQETADLIKQVLEINNDYYFDKYIERMSEKKKDNNK
ncbi:MAG: hypothetical protein ACRC0A_05905 [Chitinophagaceae bacterium]